jgi:hypothetical protein
MKLMIWEMQEETKLNSNISNLFMTSEFVLNIYHAQNKGEILVSRHHACICQHACTYRVTLTSLLAEDYEVYIVTCVQ